MNLDKRYVPDPWNALIWTWTEIGQAAFADLISDKTVEEDKKLVDVPEDVQRNAFRLMGHEQIQEVLPYSIPDAPYSVGYRYVMGRDVLSIRDLNRKPKPTHLNVTLAQAEEVTISVNRMVENDLGEITMVTEKFVVSAVK